jgi:hypothetical protein
VFENNLEVVVTIGGQKSSQAEGRQFEIETKIVVGIRALTSDAAGSKILDVTQRAMSPHTTGR